MIVIIGSTARAAYDTERSCLKYAFIYLFKHPHTHSKSNLTGSRQHTTSYKIQDYLFHSGREMRLKPQSQV